MLRFALGRLGLAIPVFLGLSVVAFLLPRLAPGDPVMLLAGERGIDPVRRAELLHNLGLDRPLPVQYLDYLWALLQGDFGRSVVTRKPILDEFLVLFPATLELSAVALLIALLLGLPAGILAALRRGRLLDHAVMTAALAGYSMPIFWWGLLLIILFSGTLGWTPVSGRIGALFYFEPTTGFMVIDAAWSGQRGAFVSALRHLVLPSIVLATIPAAVIARQTRSAMLEVLAEDYVRTARAKGLAPARVIGLHALRNALVPVLTVVGLQTGLLLSGAILTETIFSWPGIGKWLVDSIARRDYPSIQSGVLLIALVVMLVNLSVDLLYGLINPRIRHAR